MPRDDELARRMFQARHFLEGERGESVTLDEIGAAVARSVGREKPYSPSVVSRWLKGDQDPESRRLWVALARAFRVDPGWLAFGDASAAPPPMTLDEARAYLDSIPKSESRPVVLDDETAAREPARKRQRNGDG